MIKTYLILIVAIFFEVGGTMLLPVSQNFTKIIPTTTLAVFYLLSFYLITFVVDKILTNRNCLCNMEWSWSIYYCNIGIYFF